MLRLNLKAAESQGIGNFGMTLAQLRSGGVILNVLGMLYMFVALAIVCGLILTTMPITFIGEAFSAAWRRRELLLLEMRVQDELVKRGISVHDFRMLFDELDADGSGKRAPPAGTRCPHSPAAHSCAL